MGKIKKIKKDDVKKMLAATLRDDPSECTKRITAFANCMLENLPPEYAYVVYNCFYS